MPTFAPDLRVGNVAAHRDPMHMKQLPISTTIMYEGAPLRLVPNRHNNGYFLYCSRDGKICLRISPDGKKTLLKPRPNTYANCAILYNANRKQRYLQYCDAFGYHKHIYVSHAVYLAWSGERLIPLYHQVHHLSGIVADNNYDNLLCITVSEHYLVADARQRALRTVVPDGDLYCFTYERLRELQDPRGLSDEAFQAELEAIRAKHFRKVDVEAMMNEEIEKHIEFLEHD